MISVSSPALRPSHPHGCRKRAFRQGHALRGRLAGLDVHALASGLIHSRATDEEASGGGSVKGIWRLIATRQRKSDAGELTCSWEIAGFSERPERCKKIFSDFLPY